MPRLTKAYVDGVKAPATAYEIHWDDRVSGYGLRVTANGVRAFIAQGRIKGKAVIITIGRFGLFTEDQARRRAQAILQQMRDGIDPRAAKKAEEAERVTLRQVMEAYVNRPGKLKPSSKAEVRRHVEQVFATWLDRPIASITEDDIRKRHREMATKGLRGKGPAPGQANLSMTTLRALINFASRQYRRADGSPLFLFNPVDVLKDHWAKLGTRTQRYIDKRGIGTVWNALHDARTSPKNQDALAGIDLTLFLLLTGARRNEGAMLTWDRVNISDDPAACWWHLPDPKNGREVFLPLNSQAVAVLRERQKLTISKFVFSSRSKTGHVTDPRAPMELVSKIAGKTLSCHDLRRTYTNISMRECLIEKFRTDLLTCHVPAQADVTARNYLDLTRLDWLYPECQRIGDWIEQQGHITAGDNVVPLRA
ncbi:tyrosine-type recombinase/integrase [Devosia rhizoryzae]|uniref:Integrase family protein n=1 Tax=Devosia rhizoryzae TaxID=2774137 RepID=A0ABX7C5H7_9HYPH|nr:integrase family protein [Devosia rhizoryzae]QQR39466.1 integrase family protein [Devosia rhizoryzae]